MRGSCLRGPLEAPCPRLEHPHPMLRIDLSPMQGEVNTCLRRNVGVSCRRDVSIIGLFCVSRRGAARIRSGVSRSGDPPIPRPDLARLARKDLAPSRGCEVPVCTGTTEEWPGVAKLLIQLHLVAFLSATVAMGPGCEAPVCTGPLEAPVPALSTLTRCFASTSPLCRER